MPIEIIPKEKLEGLYCGICLKEVPNMTDRLRLEILETNGFDAEVCNDCAKHIKNMAAGYAGGLGQRFIRWLLRLAASIIIRDKLDEIKRLKGIITELTGEEEA